MDWMDLSDAWVVKIVASEMSAAERSRPYPAVFSTKNLRNNYVNKGQAGKTASGQGGLLRYQVVFGIYQMHGDEGATRGFPLILANATTLPEIRYIRGNFGERKWIATLHPVPFIIHRLYHPDKSVSSSEHQKKM